MAENALTDAEALALAGTTDTETDFAYHTVGQSTYYLDGFRQRHRILTILKAANELRVFQDGDLTFGVRAGRYLDGDTPVDYAGASAQDLTNNATNYIYLTADGTLTVNTTGFPTPSETPQLALATIVTAAGTYGTGDVTDYRGRALFRPAGGLARAQLAAEALARYQIPLTGLRNEDGSVVDATGGNGLFSVFAGGWGTGTLLLYGEAAQNGTETSGFCFEFILPPEYVADADVTLVLHARYTASGGTPGTTEIDAEVYELDDAGTPGSDLCATACQSLTASFADYTFTITDADLTPGDRLLVIVRTTIQETADGGTITPEIGSVELQLDVRG